MRTIPTILAILLLAAPAAAGQLASRLDVLARMAHGGVAVAIEPVLELEPVTVQELYERTGESSSMEAAGTVEMRFERQAERIWTACVRHKKDIDRVAVDYELVGSNGRDGRLASTASPSTDLAVRIFPLPPRPLGRCPADRKRWLYEAGARFAIDAAGARRAGRYTGTLTVVLNNI